MSFKFVSHKAEVLQEFKNKKAVCLEAIGLVGETNARLEITSLGAVDTGRLRNSISHETDDDSAYIGTNVEYGIYVHNGTWKMKARPFLERAVQNHKDEYKEIVENYMRGK